MTERQILPRKPTPAMLDAALQAMTNPTVENPKAAAWDALVAYRAMYDAHCRETKDQHNAEAYDLCTALNGSCACRNAARPPCDSIEHMLENDETAETERDRMEEGREDND